jgi:hypothetical protein
MKLYEVQSGDINGKFRAPDPETAFLKAMRRIQKVESSTPPMPGLVLRIREVAEDLKPISEWIFYNPLDLIKRL